MTTTRSVDPEPLPTTSSAAPWASPTLLQLHVRELQALLAVADSGSFSAAGQRLFLDASAVGKLIARLERRLSTTLAVRSTRRVTLTDAGVRAVSAAEVVLAAVESFAEQVHATLTPDA
jgi:DNA-binding transcriptional LysR family regulator